MYFLNAYKFHFFLLSKTDSVTLENKYYFKFYSRLVSSSKNFVAATHVDLNSID